MRLDLDLFQHHAQASSTLLDVVSTSMNPSKGGS